jgi:NADPH:quinone reductase-like Zn-dependent oxidoreductase
MKAMMLESFGDPDSFEPCEVPKPVPQKGQVLVRVHATSLNPLDYQVRRGDYAGLVSLPAITSHDVSGVVEAIAYSCWDWSNTLRMSHRFITLRGRFLPVEVRLTAK